MNPDELSPRRVRKPRPAPPPVWADLHNKCFVAIDFETADHGSDSACAIGLARVENLEVVRRVALLIRPPRPRVLFTHVHGITWPMVAAAPTFGELWPELAPLLDGAHFLAAHNATFDRRVLGACCQSAGLASPGLPFVCTVHAARRTWHQKPNGLSAVCARLGIPLVHHHAGSDAEGCARILIAAARTAGGEQRAA